MRRLQNVLLFLSQIAGTAAEIAKSFKTKQRREDLADSNRSSRKAI